MSGVAYAHIEGTLQLKLQLGMRVWIRDSGLLNRNMMQQKSKVRAKSRLWDAPWPMFSETLPYTHPALHPFREVFWCCDWIGIMNRT